MAGCDQVEARDRCNVSNAENRGRLTYDAPRKCFSHEALAGVGAYTVRRETPTGTFTRRQQRADVIRPDENALVDSEKPCSLL